MAFAEHHSMRNFVEHVHAQENQALHKHGTFKSHGEWDGWGEVRFGLILHVLSLMGDDSQSGGTSEKCWCE